MQEHITFRATNGRRHRADSMEKSTWKWAGMECKIVTLGDVVAPESGTFPVSTSEPGPCSAPYGMDWAGVGLARTAIQAYDLVAGAMFCTSLTGGHTTAKGVKCK